MPTTTAPAGSRGRRRGAPRRARRAATRAPVRSSAPLVRVPGGHRGGDLGGQRAGQRPVGGLDDGDRAAGLAGRGGELGADPARADDHDVVLPREHRAAAARRRPGCAAGGRRARPRRRAARSVRRRWRGPGRRTGPGPPSVSSSWSPARRPVTSQAEPQRRCRAPRSRRRRRSPRPCRAAPPWTAGGRSYGWWGSAPISVTGPVKPCSRRATAVCTPAMPAPTITTRRGRPPRCRCPASARSPDHHRHLTIGQSGLGRAPVSCSTTLVPLPVLRLPLPGLLQPHPAVGQLRRPTDTQCPEEVRAVLLELDVPEVEPVALPGPDEVPADDVAARVLGPDPRRPARGT